MKNNIAFTTVITLNYLHYVEIVYETLCKYNSGFDFKCLVIDLEREIDSSIIENCSFDLVSLDEIEVENIDEMKIYFTPFELCNALKPSMLHHTLFKGEYEKAIYLDADLFITGEFNEVIDKLELYDFILTPHINEPIDLDGKNPTEKDFVQYGIYNGGFYAFKKSDTSKEILNWLISRNEQYCFNQAHKGMFVDQNLLMMAVNLWRDDFYCLSNEGYNVSYWNLQERMISIKNGEYYTNDERVIFFHLSGFDLEEKNKLSKWDDRTDLKKQPAVVNLIKEYGDCLEAAKLKNNSTYKFNMYKDIELTPFKRKYYFKHRKISKIPDIFLKYFYLLKAIKKGTLLIDD